jgi:hypothetical protein
VMVLVKNSIVKMGVNECIVMMQQPVLLSSKISAIKCNSSMRN